MTRASLLKILGSLAIRIDHIGSTSVPGLGAIDIKPVEGDNLDHSRASLSKKWLPARVPIPLTACCRGSNSRCALHLQLFRPAEKRGLLVLRPAQRASGHLTVGIAGIRGSRRYPTAMRQDRRRRQRRSGWRWPDHCSCPGTRASLQSDPVIR